MAKSPKRYEGSAADNRKDRAEAKKHKMTTAQWERSPMDKKMDRAGQKKLDDKARKARR